jgi:hypothetical protein
MEAETVWHFRQKGHSLRYFLFMVFMIMVVVVVEIRSMDMALPFGLGTWPTRALVVTLATVLIVVFGH